jgi:citrate lyase subunit beta/citryl-CoA lyase
LQEKKANTVRRWKLPPCRSYLYVPATKLELYEKALESGADAIILDLEDGVAVERKPEGRRNLVGLLTSPCRKPLYVRINPLDTEFASEDLDAAARLPITGIRIPKARHANDIAAACERLRRLGFPGGVQLLVETAEGIMNLRELARADELVEVLGLGEGDLCSELACEKRFLWPARWEAVLASRAAGLQRPIQGGHAALADSEDLELTTREGRQAGFFGRIALHPSQLVTINRVYTRCTHEVEYARDALKRLGDVVGQGQRTTRDMHGRYLSEWYRASAERILEEFERFGALESCAECRSGLPAPGGTSYPR